MKKGKTGLALSAIAAIALAACAETGKVGQSTEATTFAALAVVPGKGRTWHGYAKRSTAKEAREAAKTKCANTKCQIVSKYKSGQCVHLVLGDDQIYWNEDVFTMERRQDVLDFCENIDENCQVIVSECLP